MPDLDNLKQEKIKEKAEKTELTGKKAPGAKSAKAPAPKAESKPGPKIVKPDQSKAAAPPAKKLVKKVLKPGGAKAGAGAGGAKKGPTKGPAAAEKGPGVGSESDISLEEAESRVEEIFNTEIMAGLGDMNWKNRCAKKE